jgi:hypothetical protein
MGLILTGIKDIQTGSGDDFDVLSGLIDEDGVSSFLIHKDRKYFCEEYLGDADDELRVEYIGGDDKFMFNAGSYKTYNEWRNLLCNAIHGINHKDFLNKREANKNKDFFEILTFSDCEGSIGPIYAAKIYDDLIRNKDKFEFFCICLDSNQEQVNNLKSDTYELMTKVYKFGKEKGIVTFNNKPK